MNKQIWIKIAALGSLFVPISCQESGLEGAYSSDISAEIPEQKNRYLNATEFMDWCAAPENGLNRIKDIGDLSYALSYLPTASMAWLELRTEKYIDREKFQTTCEHYNTMSYFRFRLKAGEHGEVLKYKLFSGQEYEKRIRYVSFGMQDDLWLIQGTDTLLPDLFHFERTFDASPNAIFLLAFDNLKFNRNESFTIVYNDQLFEKGYIKFTYRNRQLINLPNIIVL